MTWQGAHGIVHGDVLTILRELPANEFDALLCDPPYGFRFMGKAWDYDVPSTDVWKECLRVLKPGAPLLSFGGARTFHRIAIGIEDAGFELRDCLMWLYGKGFPKSQNVELALEKASGVSATAAAIRLRRLADAWTGYGTALKPAWEPCILARKPLDEAGRGTMVENIAAWGVGGLAIDAGRIDQLFGHMGARPAGEGQDPNVGRWPANLALDEEAGALLDASVAPTRSTPYPEHAAPGAVLPLNKRTAGGYADAGGPSRFFYCAKVATSEREYGCEGLALKSAGEATEREDVNEAGLKSPRAGAGRTGGARNHHPTLKPIALARWLASLIKPPASYAGAQLLVPYSGAGSEMIGALQAGWPLVLGIEGDAEYIEIANARLAAWARR